MVVVRTICHVQLFKEKENIDLPLLVLVTYGAWDIVLGKRLPDARSVLPIQVAKDY